MRNRDVYDMFRKCPFCVLQEKETVMDTLMPAYGRDYKSKKAVLEAFNANKDFIFVRWNQRDVYVNKKDLSPGTQIKFRYNNCWKMFVYVIPA
jgi:hypothetical protein